MGQDFPLGVLVRMCKMKSWPVQDAKARFSELLETCLREGPQVVTKRGADAAVLVPFSEWQRLKGTSQLTLKKWLLAPEPRVELELPLRGRTRRKPPLFD
jgi:prevent-host-death family protein